VWRESASANYIRDTNIICNYTDYRVVSMVNFIIVQLLCY